MAPKSTGRDFTDVVRADLERLQAAAQTTAVFDSLRSDWVKELGAAASVAQAINTDAARSLTQVITALNQVQQDQIAAWRTISADFGESLNAWSSIARQFNESLSSIADFAAKVAAVDWWQIQQDREADRRLRQLKWWVFASWTTEEVRHFDQSASGGKRSLERAMCDHYRWNRLRHLRDMVDSWMNVDAFRRRRRILQHALQDHDRRRFLVTVPTLVPLVEGIVAEEFNATSTFINPRGIESLLANDPTAHSLTTEATVTVLTFLYDYTDFRGLSPNSRALNRHAVLHGRTTGYGRETNSLRVFAILDQVHSQCVARSTMTSAA